MPRLVIDNREVEVPPGGTILDAARRLGLDIPTLCYREGHQPLTSCMVCLVRVKGVGRLVPSCAAPAEEGMQVESETEDIRQIRRTGLELLLGNHVGDCAAPCQRACPAHLDVPLMLRQVAAGRFDEAIATIKRDIALPAVLGRVCPELCERACRRGQLDESAAICLVKRFVAEADLASPDPYLPPRQPSTGKTVAIVGAGPTGLTAAYHLLQQGHECTVLEQRSGAGGRLRLHVDEGQLPRDVLEAEVAVIERLGARFQLGICVGRDVPLGDLQQQFDAVLVAAGAPEENGVSSLGVPARAGRVQADATTCQTSMPGVFAAGDAVRPNKLVVRAVAEGKAAAVCIGQYLVGGEVTGPPVSFDARVGRLAEGDIERLSAGASGQGRVEPADGLTEEDVRAEALRCFHCDCGKQADCKLRHYTELYGARANRYRGDRKAFERHLQHGEVVYEPGKCILCGLCVQIAAEVGEPLGLSFIGRGFDVRVGVPFDGTLAEGLQRAGRRCAEACPTGALALRSDGCGVPGAPCQGHEPDDLE